MDDTVLFLSAYNSTQYKATNWFLRKLRNVIPHKKKQMQSLLEKHHLSFVATDETITSVDGKMEVTAQYDYVHQATTFSFKSKDSAEKENNASDSLKDSGFYINLRHAQSILVDERYFKIEFTFWLEPFLVWINGQMYQIDAGAFMMNSVLFIVFEVINYKTGKPLAKDDVGAKAENYNLLSVEKYQFFDEEKPVEAGMKISEIIYENISEFIWELTNKCYRSQEYFFVHDTLVFSNNIENISDYFCKLIDTKAPAEPIKDISTVEIYQYYPQAGCSVVSDFDCDNFQPILYSAIILESLKLYIHIFQNSNLENETDLRRSVRNDIYLQNLFCSPNLPIETHNLFANCKCKLDTCTVELSESERRSGWKPLASVLGDAAAAFGCVNRVEELVKQFLRGAVAKLLARPSVQFISCSQDILSRESLNGHALRNKGSKQPVVAFVLGTFP